MLLALTRLSTVEVFTTAPPGPLAPKNPKPADLTDGKWDHGASDGEIYTLILNGAPATMSEMKPMKGTLTPTQIWQVVDYIRSIGPPQAPASAKK